MDRAWSLLDHVVARLCEAGEESIGSDQERTSARVSLGDSAGDAGLRVHMGTCAASRVRKVGDISDCFDDYRPTLSLAGVGGGSTSGQTMAV